MKTIQLDSKIKKPRFPNYIRRGRRMTYSHTNEQEIRFRNISKAEAKNEIQDYIDKHPRGSITSQIIETLRIDPLLTANILEEMKREGLALSQPIE